MPRYSDSQELAERPGTDCGCECMDDCEFTTVNFGPTPIDPFQAGTPGGDLGGLARRQPGVMEDAALWVGGMPGAVYSVEEMEVLLSVAGGAPAWRQEREQAREMPEWSQTDDPPTSSYQILPQVLPFSATIYVSAGLHEGEGVGKPSCDRQNANNCAIYRLQLSPGLHHTKVWIDKVVNAAPNTTGGAIQPAVSPSGERLAFKRKHSDRQRALYVRDLESGEQIEIAASVRLPTAPLGLEQTWPNHVGNPEFPAWFGESVLLYSRVQDVGELGEGISYADAGEKALYMVGIGADAGGLYRGEPVARWGPDTDHPKRERTGTDRGIATDFGDPDVRRPGSITSFEDFFAFNVATQGGDANEPAEAKPRVAPLFFSGEYVPTQEFDLGHSAISGELVKEGHHAAWSPAGDQIMVHVHAPQELIAPEKFSRSLYIYSFDETAHEVSQQWGDPELAFYPLTPSELQQQFPKAFARAGECERFSLKYGQFCVLEEYVITTLFAVDENEDTANDTLISRVMLIDRQTSAYKRLPGEPPPKGNYLDLTALIENWEGVERGAMHGAYGTCWSPE